MGITPFLSASATLEPTENPPVLFYCVRDRDDAMGLAVLTDAAAAQRIELRLVVSGEGERFGSTTLQDRFGPDGLTDAHIALCGPTPLVNAADGSARHLGATTIEREDFDIRQGFVPDVSREIDALLKRG